MLRGVKELLGYKLSADDETIGKLHDVLFDDTLWDVRHMVADIGSWLAGRYVLLPPAAFGRPSRQKGAIPLSLTRRALENAADLHTDPPVSKRHEAVLIDAAAWAPGFPPGGSAYQLVRTRVADAPEKAPKTDPHLRSAREVCGYEIHARDGTIGRIDDFVIDTELWAFHRAVVETGTWLDRKRVLITPRLVREVDWRARQVKVDMSRSQVADSPPYDPSAPVNVERERRVYDYHGRFKHRIRNG